MLYWLGSWPVLRRCFFSPSLLVFFLLDFDTLCCGGLFATTSTARSKRAHASECNSTSLLGFGFAMALKRSDPFYHPKRRIVRAQNHIVNLDRKIKRFLLHKPYTFLIEPDPDGIHENHIIEFIGRLPPTCDDLAFEALFTLRAALDQAAYVTAAATGKVRPKSSLLPVADTAAELDTVIKGRCRDLPDEIKTLFRRFKPYKGGNDAIWALNKLRQSAHTALAAIGIAGTNVVISHWGDSPTLEGLNPVWDSVKNQIPFARGKLGSHWNYHARPTLLIGFDEIEVVGRKSAVAFLRTVLREVKDIVEATEKLAWRIGLFK